ncbi:Sodium:sulfate symporter transmembrane region family protein [Tritrichomonas foetus]|uniref:Sodium:sulfate symporter transmembrane region family protein n=1 Tax=Tritrichomonas foetus TaxID=1144522 RepID=A0A1J4KDH7_9EUKA|nr:Sodium:sulfate symporter transmembrane region family protein [Tritrichomonas foetus]|eukprot:OHT08968.1 Sodium:sulfate symporter transmembrane region family protein [Tritrichomonas foetus]
MNNSPFLADDQDDFDSDESERSLESIDVPAIIPKKQSNLPLFACVIFSIIYMAPILPTYPTAHSCLAILCTICFLWITEAIPPFATAYLIPIMSVWLQIGIDKESGRRIPAQEMAQFFAFKFMDPIIFVFFGSLVLSTGLQKLNITSRVSRFVLSLVSPKPSVVLLVLMLINLTIGAFLSNVASTTLTLSLALPIIKSLKPNDPFIKAILFGIAWSGNCGGQPTTIASPQNVIAAHVVNLSGSSVTFMNWIYFGTPVAILLTVAQWFYLIKVFPKSSHERLQISSAGEEEPWSIKHTQGVVVTVITIILWSFGDALKDYMGHIGIASLIPIVWFFGSGILTTHDFNSLKWSTLSLLGGGLALGEAMKMSGLLDVIAFGAKKVLDGVSVWALLVIILIIEGCLASLLSSTTAASIMFPLILAIGGNTGHAPLLVVLSALMISSSQLFHISSFPNALVSGVCAECSPEVEKETGVESGTPYLKGIDYVRFGWPTIVMSVATISSLGYMLASNIGY